jgi:hypothetical protein
VTNTNNAVSGTKTAAVTSIVVTVIVSALVNAAAPIINTQPAALTNVNVGGTATLTVEATSPDGGTLSYQWFSNTANGSSGGTLIGGATSASYSPSTAAAGTFYYYVIVTNTNNAVSGTKTAAVTSIVATVTVSAQQITPTPIEIVFLKQPAAVSVAKGKTVQLVIETTPADIDFEAEGYSIKWKSLSTSKATVNETTGLVTGKASGIATIQAVITNIYDGSEIIINYTVTVK